MFQTTNQTKDLPIKVCYASCLKPMSTHQPYLRSLHLLESFRKSLVHRSSKLRAGQGVIRMAKLRRWENSGENMGGIIGTVVFLWGCWTRVTLRLKHTKNYGKSPFSSWVNQ
jgi:hypothetical protein